MQTIQTILEKNFGFNTFRPLQQESIEAIIEHKDLLTILPTGGGKSLCYQLPALFFENKITIVISPLIALINDQVFHLNANHIKATKLTSELSAEEASEVYRELKSGTVSLLYVSPERANMPSFKELIHTLDVAFFVIDEAHCVSEWGHEFRPDYRKLHFLKEEFPHIPIAAFTATATDKVADDIVHSLRLQNPTRFKGSFFRKNLYLNTQKRAGNGRKALLQFIKKYKSESGIVYTFTRRECEELAAFLSANGTQALAYHAGLPTQIRQKIQENFITDKTKVVVATIAFGMGIDKNNVRFIVHMDLPKSIEGYYQEIGRAGRDGVDSECLLLYNMSDVVRKSELMDSIEDETYRNRAKNNIEQLYTYANAKGCRHQSLTTYFGEPMAPCKDRCDNCQKGAVTQVEVTKEAQMFLSTIYRTGQSFGKGYLIDILRGSQAKKVVENGHTTLTVHGIGKEIHKESWEMIIDTLFEYRAIQRGEHRELQLTTVGSDILKGKVQVFGDETILHTQEEPIYFGESYEQKDENFETLKRLRAQIAQEEGVPAYIVFSDATLQEMAKKLPTDATHFLKLNGVGELKLEKYGERFIEALQTLKETTLSETYQKTFTHICEGKSIEEIANERGLNVSTIVAHVKRIAEAKKINAEEKERLFHEVLQNIPEAFKVWYKSGRALVKEFQEFKSYLYTLNNVHDN
jgi:ATP-dependent DNA helicase RecQ